jgi:DNA-binding CsgD family transcriptional regulator
MGRTRSEARAFSDPAEISGVVRAAAVPSDGGELWQYLVLMLGSDRAARELVTKAIEEVAPRFATIVERGSASGEPGSSVARRLGMSPSRFYRERQAAFKQLGILIERQLTNAVPKRILAPLALAELEIAESDITDRAGRPQQAIAKLRSMLERGVSRRDRVAILARLTVLYANQAKYQLAQRTLDETRSLLVASSSASEEAAVDLAEVRLAARLDDLSRAAEALHRITHRTAPGAATPEELEAAAIALCELAEAQIARSDITSARATLERLDAAFAAHPPSPEVRVRTLNVRSLLHIAFPSTIGVARLEARGAFELASGQGVAREAWRAVHTLVDNHLGLLDLSSVMAYAQFLLRSASEIGEPQPVAMASLMLAATQAQMGYVDDARKRIESCYDLASGSMAIERDLLYAWVLGHQGRYAQALDVAKRGRTSAEALGIPNLVGVGFLYESLLLEEAGKVRGVQMAAVAAARVLEAGTSPYHLANAYRRIYRLTGDREFRRRAGALAAKFPLEGSVLDALRPADKTIAREGLFGALLTTRQAEVAQLVYAGKSNREIAQALGISESTAAHHVEAILRRLGLRARWQLFEPKQVAP